MADFIRLKAKSRYHLVSVSPVAAQTLRPDYICSDTHWVSREAICGVRVRDGFAFSAMEVELPLSDAICQMYAGGRQEQNAVNQHRL
jgi:hypothetical protein